jgi:hypothetical protein
MNFRLIQPKSICEYSSPSDGWARIHAFGFAGDQQEEPLGPASTLGPHSSNPKRSDTNPSLGSGCSGQKSGPPFPLPPNLEGPCLFPVTGR